MIDLKHLRTLLACATALCPAFHGLAGTTPTESPLVWKPRVTSVVVFKNGLGFFLREGQVGLRDGWCLADAVPPATFGSLSVYALAESETVDFVASGPGEIVVFDDLHSPDALDAKIQALTSRLQLKLQLSYRQQGTERTAAGTLVSVGRDYAVLQADGNDFAVPLEGIDRLQVLGLPMRIHVTADDGAPLEQTALGMAYVRQGITWIPDYTLTLLDEDTAELTLRGTLVNEAEDIVHGDVHFVAGVPNFRHTEFMAPIAVGQVIRTIQAGVVPDQVMSQIMNRAMQTQDAARAHPAAVVNQPVATPGRRLADATGNLPQLATEGADDFTVFQRQGLTLRRGEKAVVHLFTKRIRYSHLYRWSPPEAIRHYLVLHNDTDGAWTTGPCLVRSGGSALSQDLLMYVPPSGSGELPVTTAINIAHDRTETEVERQLNAHQPAHNFFVDRVTLDGTLRLRNFGRTPAETVVTLRLQGQPLEASDDGHIVLNTEQLKLLERTGTVSWRLTLEPEETRNLTYRYERHVPSR